MIIEIIITLVLAFLIAIWFYRQRRDSIEILQVEFQSTLSTIHELVEELQPIIIRGNIFPQILSREKLSEIPRLDNFPLRIPSDAPHLLNYRQNPGSVLPDEQATGIPILDPDCARTLAKELSIELWATHNLADIFSELSGVFSSVSSKRTSVVLGGCGMKRATSIYTCIIPTEGKYILSLVNKRSESFLPANWKFRYPANLTVNDTPLVGEIQFIDIILRPGSMAILPSHCIYSLTPASSAQFHGAVIIEIDSPISNVGTFLDMF